MPIKLDTWGQFVFIMAGPSRYCCAWASNTSLQLGNPIDTMRAKVLHGLAALRSCQATCQGCRSLPVTASLLQSLQPIWGSQSSLVRLSPLVQPHARLQRCEKRWGMQ